MKNSLFLIICLFVCIISTPSYSQDYFYTDLYKAKKKAKEENKRLFVDFSAVWCGPCKMMEIDVFPDPEVKEALTKDYVCVKLMQAKNKATFKRYRINKYPTFIIMDYNGKEIYRWTGYGGKKSFLTRLSDVPLDSKTLEKYDSLYPHNKKNVEFLRGYFQALIENKNDEKAKKISKKILKYDKDWLNKDNQILVLYNLDEDKYYKFLLKNKQAFYNYFSIDKIDYQLFLHYLFENIETDYRNGGPDIAKLKREFKKIFHPSNVDKYLYKYLFSTLKDYNDSKQKQIYISSAIRYFQLEKGIMRNKFYFSIIENLLYKMTTLSQFREMKKAFEFQFGDNPEDIYLPYFDLKAFVEYMLNDKEAYINTIKRANEISVKKNRKPFRSKLKQMIFAYNLLHKDITPETLK